MAEATFAGGCFWGIEAAFRKIEGVTSAEVGYTGGATVDPSYEEVCSGRSGHAEAVRLQFDPSRISYDELLETFWSIHDPTTRDRQGPDIGSQYRSAIYVHDQAQAAAARASKDAAAARFRDPIVTEIVPAAPFYRAEEYHQQYFDKRPRRFGGLF